MIVMSYLKNIFELKNQNPLKTMGHFSFLRVAGGKVRFRLLRYLRLLLFVATKSQKLDRQKYIYIYTTESSFHKLFKNITFRHRRGIHW